MSYKEFLKGINKYVGKRVIFTIRFKNDGRVTKIMDVIRVASQYNKLPPNAEIEILNVDIV